MHHLYTPIHNKTDRSDIFGKTVKSTWNSKINIGQMKRSISQLDETNTVEQPLKLPKTDSQDWSLKSGLPQHADTSQYADKIEIAKESPDKESTPHTAPTPTNSTFVLDNSHPMISTSSPTAEQTTTSPFALTGEVTVIKESQTTPVPVTVPESVAKAPEKLKNDPKPTFGSLIEYTNKDLKELCREQGLKVTGNKKTLVERLLNPLDPKNVRRGSSGTKRIGTIDKLLREAGVNNPGEVSPCLKAGIARNYIPWKDENPLDHIVYKGTCYFCDNDKELSVTIKELLFQTTYPGLEYEDGQESACLVIPFTYYIYLLAM
eukprot:TRINITY_DN1731_c0_g1_i4.p1 TRINITY_DN1731_c0_g1~~TRINITY_DN1731_c0_g1_i4.p1  ORF type:complete len:319 (-),score=72.04 TRINITY_DN1731_c0_g1_i4:54-1010(-)